MQRRLLFLDGHRLSVYSWQNGHVNAEREFTADAESGEVFASYLNENASAVYYVLADVVEESFQIEEVPYVIGKDRNALIARRLTQYFYGTPYSLALSLGRDKAGRRDEKILFAALTQPRHLEPWLGAMRETGSQLAGVYSAPLALAALLAGTRGKIAGPQLVLSITRSGVRQTFLNEGKLNFSRLTPLATGSLEEAAIACAVEAKKIHQYLAGQQLINPNTVLDVLILAHPGQLSTFRAHCRDSADIRFEYLDLRAEADRAKLKNQLPDSRCEILLLHGLVGTSPPQQFAPPAERHFYRVWQIRTGLMAAAVTVFVSCLVYAGKQYFSTQSLHQTTLELETDRRIDQAKYEAALKALPPLSISTDNMRELVNRFEELAKRSPLLETTLIPLSHALDANPGVELQRIDWKLSNSLPIATEQLSGAFKQPPLQIAGSYYAVTEVDAHLPVALVNDHRAMLQLVNKFVTDLSQEKSMGVQVTQLPFDVESGKTIKSSADATPGQADAPKFSFRLIQGF